MQACLAGMQITHQSSCGGYSKLTAREQVLADYSVSTRCRLSVIAGGDPADHIAAWILDHGKTANVINIEWWPQ